ncbi:MAG: hypothetical protein Q4G34_01125, partial [Micrococcus sp.]|nr:hypothetical protein [Micrococcus sp.]
MQINPFTPPTPNPSPDTLPEACGGIGECLRQGVRDTVDTVVDTVVGADVVDRITRTWDRARFAADPIQYSAEQARDTAQDVTGMTLSGLATIAHPDLDAQWFVFVYRISFGIAVIIGGALLLWVLFKAARGKMSGTQAFESVVLRAPMFMLSVMFAPVIASALMSLAGGLTQLFLRQVLGTSTGEITSEVLNGILSLDIDAIVGGPLIAALMFVVIIIAVCVLLIVLIGSNIALAASGSVFPLGYVWTLDPATEKTGRRVLLIWIALLFTPPLVFLMLGVMMAMLESTATNLESGGRAVINLLTVAVIMFLTALSPWALAKFAPVLPVSSGAEGASVGVPDGSDGAPGGSSGEGGSATSALAGSGGSPEPGPGGGSSSGLIEALGGGGGGPMAIGAAAASEDGDGEGSAIGKRAGQGAQLGAAAGGIGAPAGAAAGAAVGAGEEAGNAGKEATSEGAEAAGSAAESNDSAGEGAAGGSGTSAESPS